MNDDGGSVNIVEASWIALSGAVRLELMRAGESDEGIYQFEDDSWAV